MKIVVSNKYPQMAKIVLATMDFWGIVYQNIAATIQHLVQRKSADQGK